MKPIDQISRLVDIAEQQNVCPFTNNKEDYKFVWFGQFTRYGCDLLRSRADFDERCSFEDFKKCQLRSRP